MQHRRGIYPPPHSLSRLKTDCKSYPVVFSVGFNRLELLGGGFIPRRRFQQVQEVSNHLESVATHLQQQPSFWSS